MVSPSQTRSRFAFISSNTVHWGGSEELWSATAAELAEEGHAVSVFKGRIDPRISRLRRLQELGVPLHDFWLGRLPRRLSNLVAELFYPAVVIYRSAALRTGLKAFRPDLVILSQGANLDGRAIMTILRQLKLPYVLVMQKAADAYWPLDAQLEELRAGYAAAEWCFFVSEQNHRLTEEQLGMRIPRASVVRNPFLVSWDERTDWPAEADGWSLACVGRLFIPEKGQDLLLRVLSREKWRSRSLSLTFYGEGPQREVLERIAAMHGLQNIHFGGFTNDVNAIWSRHHALLLASRCEGLPLVTVEAMLSARVPIVTDVAGREIVEDGVTGFVADTSTEDSVDEALERAWQRRAEWRSIGRAAAAAIRTLVPQNPARAFADELLRVEATRTARVERSARSYALDPRATDE